MRFRIAIFFLLISSAVIAQRGNYFLSHYTPGHEHIDNFCFDIAQDDRGVMYFATKAGVLEFDGRNWDLHKTKAAVFSLQIASSGEIFWSGVNGFGKIGIDAEGFQEVQVLKDSTSSDLIQCLAVQKQVYFLSDDAIYTYDIPSQKVTIIKTTKEAGSFTKLFELFGAVYAHTTSGLYKINNDKLEHSKLLLEKEVVFFSRIDNVYVIGTSDNKVYVCNESLQLSPVKLTDQDYADAGVIVNGNWINRQLLALGTLRGGVMFINPITGHTEEIVNYKTGLPDNEVFALQTDRSGNTWVAHDYGFTRISPDLPFRSFSHYPGLEGNLLCSYSSNSAVYVGTSLGLFKLQREDVYDELVYFVNIEIKKSEVDPNKPSTGTIDVKREIQPQTESKKKGFFSFLKKKNRQKANEETAKTPSGQIAGSIPEPAPSNPLPKITKEKRIQKILRESQYVYKKVLGIDSKVNNLVEVNGQLIASGLDGIFEIKDTEAKALLREPVHYLYASKNENILFASTYDDRVRSLVFESNSWHPLDIVDNVDDQINFIFENENREIWLCGVENIYQYQITDYNLNPVVTLALSNSEGEKTVGISNEGIVVFANTKGFFTLDRKEGKLVKIDSLRPAAKYFAYQGSIVYRDQHGWNYMGKLNTHANLKLLNLFDNLRFVTSDQGEDNLWMISGTNELYKFYSEKVTVNHDAFPLFLKSVTNQNKKTGFRGHINISEEKSSVTFEIVQPDYISPDAVEFRFLLQGMNETWSGWSSDNNAINFPYLPPGDYSLLVQAKNIFGKITELTPFQFQVLPPYWKRSWFYAMEFAILASLVLLSFRLNAKYRIVSRILTMLTIILLIQFVQTLIDSTIKFEEESPVIDFIIQVFVALLILPVEGFLRNLMFRSLDASSKFYQFIAPVSEKEALEKTEKEEIEITNHH